MESKKDVQKEFDELWEKYFDMGDEDLSPVESELVALLNKGAVLKREHDNTFNGFIEAERYEQLVFFLNHFKWEDEHVSELFERDYWQYGFLTAMLRSNKCEFYLRQLLRDPDLDYRLEKNLQEMLGYKQKYEKLLADVRALGNQN